MMTRAATPAGRVTIESYEHTCGIRWQWEDGSGLLVRGFVTSAEAYADAQERLGLDTRIVRHTAPPRAEGGA